MRIENKPLNTQSLNASFENSLNAALDTQNMPRHSRHGSSHRSSGSAHRGNESSSSSAHINAWQNYTVRQNPTSLAGEGSAVAQSYLPNLENGDHVLDLGTGAGFFPLELAQAARDDGIRINITGVDIMPNSFFNSARQNYSSNTRNMVSYQQSSLENFAFNRHYNAINADAVLPYVSAEQQLRIVARIANALAPQGNGVIQVTRDPEATSSSGLPIHALSEDQFETMVLDLQRRGVLPEDTSDAIDQNGAFTTIYLYNPNEF